jgi:hypothetical protein
MVRMERPRKKLVCGGVVLGVVAGNAAAAGRRFLERMFVDAYAAGTILGNADSRRAAAFCVLASGILGMDWRSSRLRVSFRRGFLHAVASKDRKVRDAFINKRDRCA